MACFTQSKTLYDKNARERVLMRISKNKVLKSDEEKKQLIDNLKRNLTVLRSKADMSQEEIAMIIGISRQTYCSIENSNREMTWTTYLALIFLFDSLEETSEFFNDLKLFS